MEKWHLSVFPVEVIEYMGKIEGAVLADCTFGEGGHTESFLDKGAKKVIGIDRDLTALERYKASGRLREDPRLELHHASFSQFSNLVSEPLDGILIDLGVSTRQILEAERGFSFSNPGPLDMRMDGSQGPSLEDYLSEVDEEDLANALYRNGDIKTSRSLSRKILTHFHEGRLKTTADLAALAGKRIPGKSHPATVMFMALRMAVNQELEEIAAVLPACLEKLKPGGRFVVLTFHSVEDRLVKHTFQLMAGRCICGLRICSCPRNAKVKILTSKPLVPSEKEVTENPRSRSAKLRCVEKI